VAEKVRLRRKDIKQPDEFITLSTQALAWARAHQQLVTWSGAGILVLMIAIGIGSAYRSARSRDANADLAHAMTKLQANDYQSAATDLDAVASRWDGTRVARVAALLGANAALDAGEADNAIAQLSRIQSSEMSDLPGYLQQQVLVAWGAALEAKQQWLDAAAKYKDAAAMTGPYTGQAVVGEARARELGGDVDRARELYRQAYEQFPDLPQRELIATKLPS
jgi:predicted negative regulator of RcsB-dependent stress response